LPWHVIGRDRLQLAVLHIEPPHATDIRPQRAYERARRLLQQLPKSAS
jgi:hypothetical protein